METATESRKLYATIKKMSGQSKSQGLAAVLNENQLAKTKKEKANMLAKQLLQNTAGTEEKNEATPRDGETGAGY